MTNDDERLTIRVRTSDDQEIVWSQKAVKRAGTLSNMHKHDSDVPPLVPRPAPAVCVVASICESEDESVFPVADIAFDRLMEAMEVAHYLAADGAFGCLANELLRRMAGKSVDALLCLPARHPLSRLLCPNADEVIPESERASLLAEPLFEPEDIAGFEDSTQAALKHASIALLRTLKGVSATWRKRARFELCSRTCHVAGQPTPVRREEITCINAEYLIREGRPWEVVTAGLQLPGLARLCGYGFTVDVARVRAADLDRMKSDMVILRACITPRGGEVPLELLAVAVASVGSGVAAGIPVQELREEADSRVTLNLRDRDLGVPGALVLASLIPIMGSLTSLNLRNNQIGTRTAGGKAIAEALAVSGSLRSLNLGVCGIGAEGGVAIAEALRVNGSLTELVMYNNQIGDEGAKAIGAALAVNGSLTNLNIGANAIGPEGGVAIAEALMVNGSLTSLILEGNSPTIYITGDNNNGPNPDNEGYHTGIGTVGGKAIGAALAVNGSLASLDLCFNKIGDAGAAAIAEALKINGSLTSLLLGGNEFGHKATETLKEAVRHARLSVFV